MTLARPMRAAVLVVLAAGSWSCATAPDRFYTIDPRPPTPADAIAQRSQPVRLTVAVPAIVDRPEMILQRADGRVVVLEHERWAAPFADLVAAALARDIERRRPEVAVFDGARAVAPGGVTIHVELLDVTARTGGELRLEARWRIDHGGDASQRQRVLEVPLGGDGGDALARALADALGTLAGELAAEVPRP